MGPLPLSAGRLVFLRGDVTLLFIWGPHCCRGIPQKGLHRSVHFPVVEESFYSSVTEAGGAQSLEKDLSLILVSDLVPTLPRLLSQTCVKADTGLSVASLWWSFFLSADNRRGTVT